MIYNVLINYRLDNQELYRYADKRHKMAESEGSNFNEYICLFSKLYQITDSVKLSDFQYRLSLGKVLCNDILYKWKLKDGPRCEYCENKQATRHLSCQCHEVQNIWTHVQNWFNLAQDCKWTDRNILEILVHINPKGSVNLQLY